MCHCYLHMASRQYIDDILLISCLHASDMSCALSITTICTHDMLDMIPSSMLHLRTTSLHDMIDMLVYVASPMIHTCSFHVVDGIYFHACHMIDLIASHMMNNCSFYYVECQTIFTTPYAHYSWIVLPHVFRHFVFYGVVNDSYAYHRPLLSALCMLPMNLR